MSSQQIEVFGAPLCVSVWTRIARMKRGKIMLWFYVLNTYVYYITQCKYQTFLLVFIRTASAGIVERRSVTVTSQMLPCKREERFVWAAFRVFNRFQSHIFAFYQNLRLLFATQWWFSQGFQIYPFWMEQTTCSQQRTRATLNHLTTPPFRKEMLYFGPSQHFYNEETTIARESTRQRQRRPSYPIHEPLSPYQRWPTARCREPTLKCILRKGVETLRPTLPMQTSSPYRCLQPK